MATPKWDRFQHFLFHKLPGTIILAALGGLLVFGGVVGLFFIKGPSAPTKMTTAELQDAAKAPNEGDWLELTDGYLFWPENVQSITKTRGGEVKERGEHHVPLVSKAVLDEWLPEFQRAGTRARYPYGKARVVVKIPPEEMDKLYPEVAKKTIDPGKPYAFRTAVRGTVSSFKDVPDKVRAGLTANARDHNPERMLVLELDKEPGSPVLGALCVLLVGVSLVAPLVQFLYRMKHPPSTVPVDVTAPAVFEHQGVRFQHPQAWKVQAGANPAGLKIDATGEPLAILGIQVMAGAQTFAEAFLKQFDANLASPDMTPERREQMRAMRGDLVASARQGHAKGMLTATIEHAAKAAELGGVRLQDAELGPLAGQPSVAVTIAGDRWGWPCTGRGQVIVVGDLFVAFFWAVPEMALAACGAGLSLIHGSLSVGGAGPAAAQPARPAVATRPASAPAPAPAAAGPAVAPSAFYYLSRQGQSFGPFTGQQLRQMTQTGQLVRTDLIWMEARKQWVPAAQVAGLFPG